MMQLPDPSLPWPIPMAAVALIAEREQGPRGGVALEAYRCPAGVWTIGWGETDDVHPGNTCTKEQADRWLCEDLTERAQRVRAACTVEPSPNELGAMVSMAYNVGFGDPKRGGPGFLTSTVLREHNAGNSQAAARAFGLWNKARDPNTGQLVVLNGLTIRRSLEAALYLTPEPGEATARMPQAVEAESKMTSSPINKAGAATIFAGVVGAVQEAGDGLGKLKAPLDSARALMVDTLGIPSDWILYIALIAIGGTVIYWRNRQRREGYA